MDVSLRPESVRGFSDGLPSVPGAPPSCGRAPLVLWQVVPRLNIAPAILFLQSTDADYEVVPVEAYGVAMLRGMGWKAGEGIGRTFKQ